MLKSDLLANEMKQVTELFDTKEIFMINKNSIKLKLCRSHFRKLDIHVFIPKEYPKKQAILDFNSDVFSYNFLKKIKSLCLEEIEKSVNEIHIFKVLKLIKNYVLDNILSVCWQEINNIKKKLNKNDTIKLQQKKGKILLDITNGEFFIKLKFDISYDYPFLPPKINIRSNLRERIVDYLYSYCISMSKDLSNGIAEDKIFRSSSSQTKDECSTIELTKDTVLNCKHDVDFLHKQSNLEMESDDKQCRRQLRLLNRSEFNKMKNSIENAIKDDSNKNKEKAKLSIEPISIFIITYFRGLFKEICQGCKKLVFPLKVSELNELENFAEKKKYMKKYPQRLFCGHQFHHKCLDEFITQPPFGKDCPECPGKKVVHPFQSNNVKTLEEKQAKKRAAEIEIEDVRNAFEDLIQKI